MDMQSITEDIVELGSTAISKPVNSITHRDIACALVICKVCKSVSLLLVIVNCKCSITPITNPNSVKSQICDNWFEK